MLLFVISDLGQDSPGMTIILRGNLSWWVCSGDTQLHGPSGVALPDTQGATHGQSATRASWFTGSTVWVQCPSPWFDLMSLLLCAVILSHCPRDWVQCTWEEEKFFSWSMEEYWAQLHLCVFDVKSPKLLALPNFSWWIKRRRDLKRASLQVWGLFVLADIYNQPCVGAAWADCSVCPHLLNACAGVGAAMAVGVLFMSNRPLWMAFLLSVSTGTYDKNVSGRQKYKIK